MCFWTSGHYIYYQNISKSHKAWTWTHSRSLLFHDGYTICKWFIANIGVNTDMYNHIGGYVHISQNKQNILVAWILGPWGSHFAEDQEASVTWLMIIFSDRPYWPIGSLEMPCISAERSWSQLETLQVTTLLDQNCLGEGSERTQGGSPCWSKLDGF